MNFKNILFVVLLVMVVLTIGTVCATDNYTSDEFVNIENLQNKDESSGIGLCDESVEIISQDNENDEIIELNKKSQSVDFGNDDLLTSKDSEMLADGETHSMKITINPAKAYSNEKFSYSAKLTDNGMPVSGVRLELSIHDASNGWTSCYATTNSNGVATFKLGPEPVGKYDIEVEIEDSEEYASSYVKIIQNPKTVTKVNAPKVTAKYKENKYFKVTVKNYKGKPIKRLKLTLEILTHGKSKYYHLKTNSKGIAKFNTKKLKSGTHIVYVYNNDWNEIQVKYDVFKESKIIIKKTPSKKKSISKIKTATLKLRINDWRYSKARLKTGDILLAVANSYNRQHSKGITIGTMIDAGQEGQHSTKLIKAKVWFINSDTGKVITKVKRSTHDGLNIKKLNWINGYIPYNAKVWYKHS